MKVLIVSQYFWPEQFKINDLSEALAARGHEVTVYTGLPNYPQGRFFDGYSLKGPYSETRGPVRILRAPLVPRGQSKSLQLALNYLTYFVFASLLAPFKVRGEFDVVLVHEPSPITVAIPAIVLKHLKRAPMLLWVMDLWPQSLEAAGVVRNQRALRAVEVLVRWIYKHCDKILMTSKGFASEIAKLGVGPEKLVYWPQWAENVFSKKASELAYHDDRLPKSGFVFTFAGNIGSSQDFETIVQAAILLKERHDIHFVILGDGLVRKWAESQVQVHQLDRTFHMLGQKPVETMPYYFSKSDVLLVTLTDSPLFAITVPAKIQTYLASGKPILAALNGEGAKLIEDWNAGKSCKASSPEQLANTMIEMSQLPSEVLAEMGRNAMTCYQSEFEREKLIDALEVQFKKAQKEYHGGN